jgi:hypothetical protein
MYYKVEKDEDSPHVQDGAVILSKPVEFLLFDLLLELRRLSGFLGARKSSHPEKEEGLSHGHQDRGSDTD